MGAVNGLFPELGLWLPVTNRDARAKAIFKRHYSYHPWRPETRGKLTNISPAGENQTLLTVTEDALYVWHREFHRHDGQTGINCSVFRNESQHRSSDLIREACALAWQRWPGQRLFTFVDPKSVASRNPGYCFMMAGWTRCGRTKKGLLIFEMLPEVLEAAS